MFVKILKKTVLIFGAVVIAALVVSIPIYYLFFHQNNIVKGAVVTNGKTCAKIGSSILEKGGHAVEAAIAALFCEGVSMPQSAGLGGGFLMTIYDKKSQKVHVLNSRETAPYNSSRNMYRGNPELSSRGILSVAVPGELRGYWVAYKKFGGKIPWKDLVQPTIDLCENGIPVTPYLAKLFAKETNRLYSNPTLRSSFIDPLTNATYTNGQVVKRLILAETLKVIALEGGEALNNGSLTDSFIEDIKSMGGVITKEDMNDYEPVWQEPISTSLPFDQTLYTVSLPGSGPILAYILNILKSIMDVSDTSLLSNYQKIAESFKYAYGMRTRLGDIGTPAMQQFIADLVSDDAASKAIERLNLTSTSNDPRDYGALMAKMEDHGTAHISILSPDGDAVSVTSTINLYFGSGISTNRTDIILNDEMDDFSSPDIISQFDIPPSPANYILPGKRPLSSMCPSVVLNEDGTVATVIGAAGGTKITTVTAFVILNHLWFNKTIERAINTCRLHHQLFPMTLQVEPCLKKNLMVMNYLENIGHIIDESPSDGFSALTAVSTKDGHVSASFDSRRPGAVSYVY